MASSTAAQTRTIVNSQSMALSFSPGLLAGYSLRETAGARAVVRLRDTSDGNTSREDNILITVSLAPYESTRDWFMPTGVEYRLGLYVEIVDGTIEGAAQILGSQR